MLSLKFSQRVLKTKSIGWISKLPLKSQPIKSIFNGWYPATKEMQEKTNGARTIPQIFIGDAYVGGYNELKTLEVEGKLNSLLGI